ncbi:hypothetical protein Tco_0843559 [Tanacetum coccineum]|uniref:Uncharacterized protein n=1 Tax=Tanacetum coccineum TaxID=301880 RepID=A0ABQ5B582_9ASTR
MAPMALSDSKVNNDKSCSKTCMTNYEALKKQYDDLFVKLDDTGFKAATYKRGLSTLEEQIIKYREHEVLFSEEIALLKRSVDKSREENIDDSLEQHQITDTETSSIKSSLKVDKDWKEKFFYPANHVESAKIEKPVRKNNDAPIIEDWVSDDEDEVKTTVVVKKKTVIPTAAKIEKPVRKPLPSSILCWELNTSELVLPRDELVLLSQQLVLLEENSSYCSRLQLPVLNQSVNTARITAVGEKVNATESLLVVSTEVNAD